MLSIGQLSRRVGVKVPTIRYYEDSGLMPPPERTEGNQRRYDRAALERLGFIRHARELGFPIDAIRALLELSERPDHPCAEADRIASEQLRGVRSRIARLQKLEAELARLADCGADGSAACCDVLKALGDHSLCASEH